MNPTPSSFCSSELQKFPPLPGVYLMKNNRGKVLYIGKAINLKQRIKSYFIPGRDGRIMVPFLTSQVTTIDVIVVSSEKEALILENNLIKTHHPKYNALLKDDKTFLSLMLNVNHPWPMLKIVRLKGRPPADNLYFGPYPNGYAARQTLELLRLLFPLRQCSDHELYNRTRPCILYDMKKCLAPCCHLCTSEQYQTLVTQITAFLRGQDRSILKQLHDQLKQATEHLQFEKAQHFYQLIQAVEKTLASQTVQQVDREDLDVLALAREGDSIAVTQQQYREGCLISSHSTCFHQIVQDDEELLTSFLLQQYQDHLDKPKLILLSHSLYSSHLSELIGCEIQTPKKGDKKRLIDLALLNAQIALKRAPTKDVENILLSLEEKLSLTHYPERIECVDQSHLSGSEPVSAIITFLEGQPSKKDYRKYKLKTNDDYSGLKEVLTRRFRETQTLPDLLVIDGGKGHLTIALEVLSSLNISSVDVLALAKEAGRHDKGLTQEKIFLPHVLEPILLPKHSPELLLLQSIRDEAHRYVLNFQKTRRKKQHFQSELDNIPGIGPVKKKRLLTHFGSVKQIRLATEEEWEKVPGITKKDLESLYQWRKAHPFDDLSFGTEKPGHE
ncbi:MAG: excinuclease ABC subunit UvrC [Verrucomicrobia bacterium]|nr:excinuclease ABC subunit UvrC [Verrucomicrobiota bacterium]MBS0645053.1 excinuclease ABC subunit UvrC [Verrucomicrobiota bacterium]